jgi:hypothetical protein
MPARTDSTRRKFTSGDRTGVVRAARVHPRAGSTSTALGGLLFERPECDRCGRLTELAERSEHNKATLICAACGHQEDRSAAMVLLAWE